MFADGLFTVSPGTPGYAPDNNTVVGTPQFFFLQTYCVQGWQEFSSLAAPPQFRFFLEGEREAAPVPAPTSIVLLGAGLATTLRKFRKTTKR